MVGRGLPGLVAFDKSSTYDFNQIMKPKNPFGDPEPNTVKSKKRATAGSDSDKITLIVPKYVGGAAKAPEPYACKPPRDRNGRLLPGASLNPLGIHRAMNLAHYAGELTGGGRELIDFLLAVVRGEVKSSVVTAKGDVVEVPPSNKERMDAADRLLDRTVGKAPATLTVDTGQSGEGVETGWLERAPIEAKAALIDVFRMVPGSEEDKPQEKQPDIVDAEVVPAHQAEGHQEGE